MYLPACSWLLPSHWRDSAMLREKSAWIRGFGGFCLFVLIYFFSFFFLFFCYRKSPSVGPCLAFSECCRVPFRPTLRVHSEASGVADCTPKKVCSADTHCGYPFPPSSDRKLTEGKTTLPLFVANVPNLQKQCRVRSCCKLQDHTR